MGKNLRDGSLRSLSANREAVAPSGLVAFVRESNRIEGIHREPTQEEIAAHWTLLAESHLTVTDIELFVAVVAPGAELRTVRGMDVRVGRHVAPRGGPKIRHLLTLLLDGGMDAYRMHLAYENLHPFMDGNGRSGRAIWLWQMGGTTRHGFLHHFYYQTLRASDKQLIPASTESVSVKK